MCASVSARSDTTPVSRAAYGVFDAVPLTAEHSIIEQRPLA